MKTSPPQARTPAGNREGPASDGDRTPATVGGQGGEVADTIFHLDKARTHLLKILDGGPHVRTAVCAVLDALDEVNQ